MPRYQGKAVTESNPFISQESNEIDANTADNPILDNNDPGKESAPDREHGNDFEVAGEDLVELKKTTENDVIEEGEVLNKITEIDNIAEEGQKTADAVEALAAVSTEMYAILADKGYFTQGEAMVLRGAVATFEHAVPDLSQSVYQIPSMEDFKIPGLEYNNAQVSMEAIGDKIATAANNLGLNLKRLFKNGVGLANSMTPLINSQITRAERLRADLNNAKRDPGQKTVTGKFVKALSVEGRSPDASTTVRTASYLSDISKNVLGFEGTELAATHLKNALRFIDSGVDFTKIEKPSMWLLFVIWIARGARAFDHPIAKLAANTGDVAQNEVNRRVFDKLRLSGEMAPELFNTYPTVARVNTSAPSKNLDAKKSLPLFGDVEIVVTQYSKTVNMTLGHTAVPSLTLRNPADWNRRAGTDMQSLNPSQQQDVIDSALTMLQQAREYYKNYAYKNGKCMEVYQSAFQMKRAAKKESKANGFGSADGYILPVYDFYTRIYWRGLFNNQSKIASYMRTSAKNLISLVEASSEGAQGGSPSQEAYTAASDFF